MSNSTDVFEIMHTTRAMRRLKPDPVPDELIRKILEAGVCAANGGNTQRWRFLVIKDPEIKQAVQRLYKRAFDEVVGPRYASSAPPPGVTAERYQRQHAAVEYLTEHFHEAPVWIVACIEDKAPPTRWSGASIYPAVQNMLLAARALGLGLHADHAAPAAREGGRGGAGPAGGRALLRHPADRLSDGSVRPGRPRRAGRYRLSRTNGASPGRGCSAGGGHGTDSADHRQGGRCGGGSARRRSGAGGVRPRARPVQRPAAQPEAGGAVAAAGHRSIATTASWRSRCARSPR